MAKPERIKPRHETVLDSTEEQIARVYAQAFMAVAEKSPNVAGLVEQIASVVRDVLDPFPDLEEVFRSALVAHERKEAIIDEVLGRRAAAEVVNFLKVLARHGRLGLLRPVARHVEKLDAQRRGQTDVDVRVAVELDKALLTEIEGQLRQALGIEPVLHVTVDPSLIAGVVVRVGDRVYDGSLSTQFDLAQKAMVDRARDKIEARPQTFLHPPE
jgi:F-type H+-transporting ATPase subunit delta